ncbi:MAG: ABC transporter ATP-binding protein [Bacillota bacterium]
MEIVSVSNLCKTYGKLQAVRNVSFSIQKGEIFGFLGPNGAGKTSTINMMIGLSRPSAGSITIAGFDAVREIKKVQAVIGVVPDESNLYGEMDGFDNLCFCASLYGMRKADRETRARELLRQFNLDDIGRRPFKAYSKGMKRKLTIAAGIIHSPQVLFLDEPTTGIDVENARQIRDLLLELKKKGTTIFITTHYIEEAERICDRIAFIVAGRIVAEGTVEELMSGFSHGHSIKLNIDGCALKYLGELRETFPDCGIHTTKENVILIKSEKRIPLSPVLQFLDGKGIPVFEARELRPTLEDVFVQITGIEASRLKKEKEQGGGKK